MRRDILPAPESPDPSAWKAAFCARFDAVPRRLLLGAPPAQPLPLAPPEFVRWLVEQGCRVGLAANALPAAALPAVRAAVAAGVSAVEATFPAATAGPFDTFCGRPGAFEDTFAGLVALRAAPTDDGRPAGRAFPTAWVEARILLDAVTVAAPEALERLVGRLVPLVHRLQFDLWPRRSRSGRVVLPGLDALRELLGPLLTAHGGGWADGGASVGLGAWTGFPACLFAATPELLRFLRLDPPGAARPPAAAGPTATAACRACAARAWCPPAVVGREGAALLAAWAPALVPFAELPPALGRFAELPSAFRTAATPGVPRVAYGPWRREGADAFLWEGSANVLLTVGPADLPPALPAEVGAGFGVLLVRPPGVPVREEHGSLLLPPLSLVHLRSMLHAAGVPTRVVDLAAEANRAGLQDPDHLPDPAALRTFCRERLAERLAEPTAAPLRLVGWSAEHASAAQVAADLSADLPPAVSVVLGGRALGAAFDGVEALGRWPRLDFVVEGEGELPLVALVDALARGREPRAVPGLAVRQAGRVDRAPSAAHDLAAMAPPQLDWVDFRHYPGGHRDMQAVFPEGPVAAYLFVRGCPFRCAFCGDYSEGRFTTRPVPAVLADLAGMVERTGVRNYLFLNTLLNPTRRYLAALLDGLERADLGLRFIDSAKPRDLAADDLQRLRAVGCAMLTWGADTGSEQLARRMNKGVTVAEATDVVRRSHAAGIINVVNFIQGMPHETDEDIRQTIDWIRVNRPYVWRVRVAEFDYLRNSPLYRTPERFGIRKRPEGRGFDEVDGRPWQEKQAQMDESFRRVQAVVDELELGWR
jgi:hypothetical protein